MLTGGPLNWIRALDNKFSLRKAQKIYDEAFKESQAFFFSWTYYIMMQGLQRMPISNVQE